MKNTPQSFFTFSDGILHVRVPLTEIRLRWTPVPLAEEKNHRGQWVECRPEFRLLRPAEVSRKNFELDLPGARADAALLEQKRQAFEAFRAVIPAEFVALVERFGSHQWTLLKLLQAEKAMGDLAKSNPVLAYGLANNAEFRSTKPEPAAFLAVCYSKRKQRVIAKWLGFPDSEAVVKLLKKIPPEAVHPSLLRRLSHALNDHAETLALLAHQPILNAEVLELVVNPNLIPLATPRLLAEMAAQGAGETDDSPVNLLCEAMSIVERIAPDRQAHPFASLARIRDFYEAVRAEELEIRRQKEARRAAEIARTVRKKPPEKVFPPPPIPGTAEIVPLTSVAELMAESRAQCNCVGSYGWIVGRGRTYVYRVTHPERCTLSIVKGSDGCWRREQLKKARNRPVHPSTSAFVDNWLAKHRLSV